MQRQNNNLQRKKEPDNSSSVGSTLLGVLFAGAAVGLTAFLGYQVNLNKIFQLISTKILK
jgi:hypothetical protein